MVLYIRVSTDISIHALLAESDPFSRSGHMTRPYFYPRSPCGERPGAFYEIVEDNNISIHALLAESDTLLGTPDTWAEPVFLSTLSLRRATPRACPASSPRPYFYPRSPCGERPLVPHQQKCRDRISIHALLAESDPSALRNGQGLDDFYPRSPCGERHNHRSRKQHHPHFYPRSPCGERPTDMRQRRIEFGFLSTLSLRRATCYGLRYSTQSRHFYPRSPCGERLIICLSFFGKTIISIHALLAESDYIIGYTVNFHSISIHALLAESDKRFQAADMS